jgi:hypothetical protein
MDEVGMPSLRPMADRPATSAWSGVEFPALTSAPTLLYAPVSRFPCADGPIEVGSADRQAVRHRVAALRPSPVLRGAGTAAAVVACWATATDVSGRLRVSVGWRDAALFVHLGALIVGLGAVVALDWLGLLWTARRRSLAEVTRTASALHPLICAAVLALLVSGAMLHPDMSSTLTRVKLALVLVVAVNGLYVTALQPRLRALRTDPPFGLLAQAATAALVSQLCWWTTVAIGLANSRHR